MIWSMESISADSNGSASAATDPRRARLDRPASRCSRTPLSRPTSRFTNGERSRRSPMAMDTRPSGGRWRRRRSCRVSSSAARSPAKGRSRARFAWRRRFCTSTPSSRRWSTSACGSRAVSSRNGSHTPPCRRPMRRSVPVRKASSAGAMCGSRPPRQTASRSIRAQPLLRGSGHTRGANRRRHAD